MSEENPYLSPEAPSELTTDGDESLDVIARKTFRAWEEMRLVYIGVMIVVTAVTCLIDPFTVLGSPRFWMVGIVGVIIANVCYFAGPLLDTYVTWVGFRVDWLRPLIFVLGTLFASCLAVVVVVGFSVAAMD